MNYQIVKRSLFQIICSRNNSTRISFDPNKSTRFHVTENINRVINRVVIVNYANVVITISVFSNSPIHKAPIDILNNALREMRRINRPGIIVLPSPSFLFFYSLSLFLFLLLSYFFLAIKRTVGGPVARSPCFSYEILEN